MGYKLIIAGSRNFDNYELLVETMAEQGFNADTVEEVISGCAHGADQMGTCWAGVNHIPVKRMPADWAAHGKVAGFIRNSEMAEYANACIVFWNGTSKGSKHMIDIAKRKPGMKLIVVTIQDVTYADYR